MHKKTRSIKNGFYNIGKRLPISVRRYPFLPAAAFP